MPQSHYGSELSARHVRDLRYEESFANGGKDVCRRERVSKDYRELRCLSRDRCGGYLYAGEEKYERVCRSCSLL